MPRPTRCILRVYDLLHGRSASMRAAVLHGVGPRDAEGRHSRALPRDGRRHGAVVRLPFRQPNGHGIRVRGAVQQRRDLRRLSRGGYLRGGHPALRVDRNVSTGPTHATCRLDSSALTAVDIIIRFCNAPAARWCRCAHRFLWRPSRTGSCLVRARVP